MSFKIKLKKSAIKDMKTIHPNYKQRITDLVVNVLPAIENLSQISDCEKMKGYAQFFRIRIGDYRVGFELRDNMIVIYRIMHRKDIYKFFP